jgi:hypothetical protein
LQGRVFDGEAFGEQGVTGVEHGFPLAQIPHHQMRREHHLSDPAHQPTPASTAA